MISAYDFLSQCKDFGFQFFTGTPCSYLKPFINFVIESPNFEFIDATNEGDAVAIAAGATLAGKKSVVMFQNSGLGNAINPLSSLTDTFKIPMLLIVTHRGEPGGPPDEPQHELMGQITIPMLETLKLGWDFFPNQPDLIRPALLKAAAFMEKEKRPFVFIMKKNDVSPYPLKEDQPKRNSVFNISHQDNFLKPINERYSRTQALKIIQSMEMEKTVLIATTGKTGRELFEMEDRPNQFYMVGSMGCALPLGLGISLARPDLKVVVIDGDGALLMRTGSMGSVGYFRPKNLIHILLDNEVHDSTGGQKTASPNISFGALAKGFNYKNVFTTDCIFQFENYLRDLNEGPTFLHLKIKKGSPFELGRPGLHPYQVAERFKNHIANLMDLS